MAVVEGREEILAITGPGPNNGTPATRPSSEPESRAWPILQGSTISARLPTTPRRGHYWGFQNCPPVCTLHLRAFARESGYVLSDPEGVASYAGYKDWFIQDWRRPGYTIEVGLGKNPLPISQFNKIYADNLNMLLLSAVI